MSLAWKSAFLTGVQGTSVLTVPGVLWVRSRLWEGRLPPLCHSCVCYSPAQYFFFPHKSPVVYSSSLPCNLCFTYLFWLISFTLIYFQQYLSFGFLSWTSEEWYPPPSRNSCLRQTSHSCIHRNRLQLLLFLTCFTEPFHSLGLLICVRACLYSDPRHHLPVRIF